MEAYLATAFPGIEALASLLHRRTDGNPLYVECLLRSWIEAGGIEQRNGAWTQRSSTEDLARDLSDTLRGLLERESEQLADADRRTLEVASVAGRRFSAAAVAAARGDDLEDVEERLAGFARRQRFLRDVGSHEWPDGTRAGAFEFVHDVHREVLYGGIPAARRKRLHGALAAVLAAAYADEPGERASELAGHFLEARDSAAAAMYLELAADRTLQRGAYGDAVRQLTTALDLIARMPDLRDRERRELSLRTALAGARVGSEGWSSPVVDDAYREAIETARRLGDCDSLASLLYELAALHEVRGSYPSSQALLDEALQVAGTGSDPARRVEMHDLMACSLFHQGEFHAALDHAERGLTHHAPGQHYPIPAFHGEHPAVGAHSWAAFALWCLGQPQEALARSTAGLELAREPGLEYSLAHAATDAARLHQLRREPEQVLAYAERAVALAQERALAYQLAVATIMRGWALAALGRHAEGLAQLDVGLARHHAIGAEMDRPYFLALLAEARLAAGHSADASDAAVEALAKVRGGRTFFYEAELHRLAGVLLGEGGAAEREFRSGLEVARRQGATSLELRAATSLADLLRRRGDHAGALAVLAPVHERFGADLHTADFDDARRVLSLLRERNQVGD